MVYLDTSVIIAYYCPEKFSDIVESYIRTIENPAISNLTELEFCSAISHKIRTKEMSLSDGEQVLAQFRIHIQKNYYYAILINSEHYQLAKKWITQFSTPLRSLDALHLAVASLSCGFIVTADKKLAKAASHFGVKQKFISAA